MEHKQKRSYRKGLNLKSMCRNRNATITQRQLKRQNDEDDDSLPLRSIKRETPAICKYQNRPRVRDPQNLIDLQIALDNLLDYLKKLGEDLPDYYTPTPCEIATFEKEEDNFIIRYLHRNSASIVEQVNREIFRQMLQNFPTKRTAQELKNRAVELCKSENEANLWRLITNRCQDISIQKHLPEYEEFQRISTLIRYYILPMIDPNHPSSPMFNQNTKENVLNQETKSEALNEEY